MLSVQNVHLGQAENNESVIVHAGRRGGPRRSTRRVGTRPSARGGIGRAGRWALGAGAATAGLVLMGRSKRGRKYISKAVNSKFVQGAWNSKGVTGVRKFVGARRAGLSRIAASARGAAGRVGTSIRNSRAGTAVRNGYSRAKGYVSAARRYGTGVRKRASIGVRRATRGPARSTRRVRRIGSGSIRRR